MNDREQDTLKDSKPSDDGLIWGTFAVVLFILMYAVIHIPSYISYREKNSAPKLNQTLMLLHRPSPIILTILTIQLHQPLIS